MLSLKNVLEVLVYLTVDVSVTRTMIELPAQLSDISHLTWWKWKMYT